MGYWIFLIILYGLSSYLRKRRRQQARDALEQEDQKQGEDKPQRDWRRSEIFKELFGGPEPEPVTAGPEDTDIFDWDQADEPAHTVPAEPEIEPKKPVTEPVRVERSKREAGPPERRKHSRPGSKIEKEIEVPLLQSLRSALERRSSLKEAIIMREIIERPLALRRKSR
ncbi:MAG: hypothetical protein V3U16_03650 [Candidatus Neomarinimicrobiota bacterium]